MESRSDSPINDNLINIEDFFAELESRGVNIHLDEKGALRVKAKKDQLDKALIDKLKSNKVAIFHWLKQQRAAEAPLSDEQRHHLVHGLNQAGLCSAASEAFGDLTIHGLFESQVVDFPHNIAVEYGTQKLTYAQLNQHANRLAFFLRHKGMATEALVGICFEPCVDMIVAMLAVLKAGGTYVPLDPDSSAAKLKQSEVEFVLTRKLKINLFSRFTTECYAIDDAQVSQAISCCASANPPLLETQSAVSLACVLFVKGDAGQTNGIMIEHGNVVRLVNKPNYLLLNDTDTVAQGTNTLYDPALF
ncbi:MAG: AMP-binding protein, partial [Algicola sp.]|nr:AMP-binding protein [Algicola sp.]